jgi:ribonuclease BN (tRNA processing enzyme)
VRRRAGGSVWRVRLTVIGKSPAFTDAGGACSGYLVEDGGTRLLVDCGNGVFGKLRAATDPFALDGVVISHVHADHVLDLVPFAYALLFARGDRPFPPMPLHVPPGGADRLHRLSGIWGDDGLLTTAFDVREYDPGATLRLGDVDVRFAPVPHYVPAWAVSLGGRVVFGADCAPNDAVVELARGAGVLLLEATLAVPESAAPFGHLTPAQAGELAQRAGVPRLVVTHVPSSFDEAWVRAEAARTFTGVVDVAREGAAYDA